MFDGHAGRAAASFSAKTAPTLLEEKIKKGAAPSLAMYGSDGSLFRSVR